MMNTTQTLFVRADNNVNWEILEIQAQKKNKERFNILTDEGFLLSLSAETILLHHIEKGRILEEDEVSALRAEDNVKYAKNLAAEYISYAPRTQKQVEDYLAKKGLDEDSIGAAIDACIHYGYIDDKAYAERLLESYKGSLGKRAIREKMRQKGISSDVIESVDFSEEDQKMAANAVAQKLRKRYEAEEPGKRRQHIYQALIRKGFSYEEASTLARNDPEDDSDE